MISEVGNLTVFDEQITHYLGHQAEALHYPIVARVLKVGVVRVSGVVIEFNADDGRRVDGIIEDRLVVDFDQRTGPHSVVGDHHSLKTVLTALVPEAG